MSYQIIKLVYNGETRKFKSTNQSTGYEQLRTNALRMFNLTGSQIKFSYIDENESKARNGTSEETFHLDHFF